MEAFEHIVKLALEQDGYLVTSNVKFPVRRRTRKAGKKEKQTHGYEVDLVAAKHRSLLLVSCKSFLGSRGVSRQGFKGIADKTKKPTYGLHKYFNDARLRTTIMKIAKQRYGYPIRHMQFALYAGRFKTGDEQIVRDHLSRISAGAGPVKAFSLTDVLPKILELADSKSYQNDPVVMTVKCLREMELLRLDTKAKHSRRTSIR